MSYRVHRIDVKLSQDQHKLEQFFNSLKGEIVAVIPNVSFWIFWIHRIDFLLVVEREAS